MQDKQTNPGRAFLSLLTAATVLWLLPAVPARAEQDSPPAATSQPAPEEVEITAEDRRDILEAWRMASMQFVQMDMMMRANTNPQDRQAWLLQRKQWMLTRQQSAVAQQNLQSNSRLSLRVLLEDKYPPATVKADASQIGALIKSLHDDSWRVREQATLKLRAIGRPARAALLACAQDPDLEVQGRAAVILRTDLSEERSRIERLGVQVVISTMKLDDLLPLARKHFLAMAEDETPMNFVTLVRDPLMGALRYSEEAHDRDLIALAKAMSTGQNERHFEQIMRPTGLPMTQFGAGCFWKQPPPKHDYTGALDRLVDDPRDAQVLAKALQYVTRDAKLLERLKTLRGKTKDKAIIREIDAFLAVPK